MLVTLERKDGQGPVISINAEGPTIGGLFKSIDEVGKMITISTAGSEQTYALSGDTVISLNGLPANLSDLQPGTSVALKLSVDKKTVLAMTRARGRGEGPKGSRRNP